ncbi:hypothetical protein FRC06_004597, partial [Ceratobasidium sp. 370]
MASPTNTALYVNISSRTFGLKNGETPILDSITDIGLPSGHTRDKILNTNNYAESFIKTFKYTMLGMRRNKRVDTLVIIIADLLLPFYKIWRNNRVHHTKEHVEITHNGYRIWSSGSVKKLDQDSQFQIDDFLSGKPRRYKINWGADLSCTCTKFNSTGKLCQHMWAVKLYNLHGDVQTWA